MPSHVSHPGQLTRRLVAAALAVLAFAIAPASAQAAQTGIVPDITWGISNKAQDDTAAAMTELHSQWARLNISWSDWVEPSDQNYNNSALSHFDRGVDLARAGGYRVMVTVEESPSWAHDGSNKNSPPRSNAELAEFMSFIANRYRGKVEAYQVWNEPNLQWAWPSGPNPGQYAQMLRDVAPAIRAADPAAKVVFAGISRNDYQYLEGVYNAMPDIGNYYDIMATHPYVFYGRAPEDAWLDEKGRIAKGTFSGYREIHNTMEYWGDSKPIWMTEFGWSTTTDTSVPHNAGVSAATQGYYLQRAFDCLAQDPYVEVAFWYNLRNEYWNNDANTWVSQLGLMNTNFSRKPAFYSLKNYVPGMTGSCTYQDPFPASDPDPPTDPSDPSDPSDPTATPSTDDDTADVPLDEAPVSSSTVRSAPMLAVSRASFRNGRLAISGRLAREATGKVRGFAHFGRGARRFQAHVDDGKIRVEKRLRGAQDASSARIVLVYAGNRHFKKQRVVLKAARRGARLRVETGAESISGTVDPSARGPVVLRLSYRTDEGRERVVKHAKIRNGQFSRSLSMPSDARNAVVEVVYAGDPERGIAGATAVRNVSVN